MIVVDTDVLIDALRGREAATERVAGGLRRGILATTTINRFELLSGARSAADRDRVEQLLAPVSLLPFDENAATEAARVRRALLAEGRTIGMADYMIAGICLSRAFPLLTRNLDHFGRVPDLKVERL